MTKDNARRLIRGRFFDFDGVVSKREELETRVRLINDGLLIIEHGKIAWFGEWLEGKKLIANHEVVTHYQDKIISPGFIDTHVHYPQAEMIAAYGEQLLEWLNTHTFPTEEKYSDWDYAYSRASFFISQLLRNGTTTALVFGSVHPESVDALFTAADSINMRIIAGKVMMDRNAPPSLCDTAESSYLDSKKLIEKWHEKNRLLYAVTPRFAPTSTPNQLAAAQRLKAEHPSTYLHTHLSENKDEIAWVKSLYPECKNYLDVYHQYNLTGCRSIFAHCIHLDEHEWGCLENTNSSIAFCPTSNLFLGSGLFKLQKAWHHQVRTGIGTDIGAGTSFNIFQTMNEAYKTQQLQDQKLSAYEAFYLATLGGAHSLSLEDKIGSFEEGKEADFVVIDPTVTGLQRMRYEKATSLHDQLFSIMMLCDDRNIFCTYISGCERFNKN